MENNTKNTTALTLSIMMVNLMTAGNMTALTILIPSYIEIFQTDLVTVQWLSTGYTIAQCMGVLAVGYLADKYSARRVYLIGVAAFLASSLFSMLAVNIYMLIVFRMMMGVAGGFTMASGPSIIYQCFPEHKQMRTVSYFTAASGIGCAFAPAIAGSLEVLIGWRCLFVFNVTIILLIIWPLWKNIPKVVIGTASKLDLKSYVCGALGTLLALFALSFGSSWGWLSARTLVVLAVGLALLGIFIAGQWRSETPLLNIRIVRNKYFRNSLLMYGVASTAMVVAPFVMSFYFQKVLGFTTLEAGRAIIIPTLAMSVSSALTGKISDNVPSKPLIVGFYSLLALSTFMLGGLNPQTSMLYILFWYSLRYASMGVSQPLIVNCAYSLLDKRQISHASSVNTWVGFMCQALALAVFTGVMNDHLAANLALGQSAELAMCGALNDITVYAAAVTALCVPIAFLLKDKAALRRQGIKIEEK